jgi:hypothetical protein
MEMSVSTHNTLRQTPGNYHLYTAAANILQRLTSILERVHEG